MPEQPLPTIATFFCFILKQWEYGTNAMNSNDRRNPAKREVNDKLS